MIADPRLRTQRELSCRWCMETGLLHHLPLRDRRAVRHDQQLGRVRQSHAVGADRLGGAVHPRKEVVDLSPHRPVRLTLPLPAPVDPPPSNSPLTHPLSGRQSLRTASSSRPTTPATTRTRGSLLSTSSRSSSWASRPNCPSSTAYASSSSTPATRAIPQVRFSTLLS